MKNEFIAYDKKNKHFITPESVAVNGDGDVFLYAKRIETAGYGFCEVYDNHIEILEYSGKKDRIGTKLYKGDIVKVELEEYSGHTPPHYEVVLAKTIIGVIVIRPSEGARILIKKIIPEGVAGITKGRTLRIKEDRDVRIGHIYTNPELIEKDSEVSEDK